jgi:hypothetical protein
MTWYSSHCDGDWEHTYGIEIGTLDNPGWRVVIDLTETELEGKLMSRQTQEESDADWVQWWADGATFQAACGPMNLSIAIEAFLRFARRE